MKHIFAGALLFAVAAGQTPQHKDRSLGYDDTPYLPDGKWRVHDVTRPRPPVVTPGSEPGRPPSDAIVLFDGTDLSKWVTYVKGQPTEPKWKVENGYMEVVDKAGGIQTREKFGDIQLHVEWASPAEVKGDSQARGNSGVLLMTRYEVQVMDSYDNPSYADGQAGAIYGQTPPLVNACRKPGEWQTYDIVFEAPRFDGEKLVKPGYVTLFQNGVLIHNRREVLGTTPHAKLGIYKAHGAEEPLELQNHHNPVRFRNVWVRRLKGYDQQ
jgi:Domain of Unknown Function (DUF1080)